MLTSCCINQPKWLQDRDGGAFYFYQAYATITNSHFIKNVSSGAGGVLDTLSGSWIVLNGNYFEGNSADYGGALYLSDSTAFANCNTFKDNNALDGDGGAIYGDYPHLELSYNTFVGNHATRSGGAVYMFDQTMDSLKNLYDTNEAPSGGAVYVDGSTVNLNGDVFTGNLATDGVSMMMSINSGFVYLVGHC